MGSGGMVGEGVGGIVGRGVAGDCVGSGVGTTGAGAGVGETGAEVGRTGAGVGTSNGAGVGVTGAGVGNTGAGVRGTGAGVGSDVDEANLVEMLALAGTVPRLIVLTVILRLLVVMLPPALSFTCKVDRAYPVPVDRVVTRT